MEKLKELLANECSFRPSGKLLDELLAPAESIELKKNEVLIMSGRLDPNVYIVKSGVMRYSYMNGIREVTFAFALPGSVIDCHALLLRPSPCLLPNRSLLQINRI